MEIVVAAGAVVLAACLFFGVYRPWHLSWGATGDEISRSMPGDDVVCGPVFNATRAVTVNASPDAIWPWLLQIGFGRAGWYSYDLLDNLGRHSAERVLPGLQHVGIGDLVPLGPGSDSGMRVKAFERNRWLLWWDNKTRLTTWAWALEPMSNGQTTHHPGTRSSLMASPDDSIVAAAHRSRRLSDDAEVLAWYEASSRSHQARGRVRSC